MAVRLSGYDSNSCRPRMALAAALFPDPDRPRSTRRSSDEDETGDEYEEEEGCEEDKTLAPGAEAADVSRGLSSELLILCRTEKVKGKIYFFNSSER